MLAPYTLLSRGFQNVKQNNQIIGFQVLVRIAYYQGIPLPKIGNFEAEVDGEKFGVDKMLFSVGRGTYTYEETAKAEDVRWNYGDLMTLTILKPGGLKPGTHDVYISQRIMPSYMGPNGTGNSIRRKITLVI